MPTKIFKRAFNEFNFKRTVQSKTDKNENLQSIKYCLIFSENTADYNAKNFF